MSKKSMQVFTMIIACIVVMAALTGCGETVQPATVTAVYTYYSSPIPSVDLTESYGVVMYLPTYTIVELYDDGTYISQHISTGYWGADGGATTKTTTTYFGTYTLTPDSVDDEKATIELSAPTRIIDTSDMTQTSHSYDTADEATFEDSDTNASDLLASGAARTLVVNTKTKTIESGV